MIDNLEDFLQEWRKKSEILKFLSNIDYWDYEDKKAYDNNDRKFRNEKKLWNKLFREHKVKQYLAHSNSKGYKLTDDSNEMIDAENDYIKRGRNDLYEAYSNRKARLENNNYSFNDFLEEQKRPDTQISNLS